MNVSRERETEREKEKQKRREREKGEREKVLPMILILPNDHESVFCPSGNEISNAHIEEFQAHHR